MDDWEILLRRLTLERQTGMPRWNLTRAPEREPRAMTDSAEVVAERRRVLEEIEEDEKAKRRHLRRVA